MSNTPTPTLSWIENTRVLVQTIPGQTGAGVSETVQLRLPVQLSTDETSREV